MSTDQCLQDLSEAQDLVRMLEELTDSLRLRSESLPWGGIKLTLEQIRLKITDAEDALAEGVNRDSPSSRTRRMATLAERIQQAPTGRARVRDLSDGEDPAHIPA